MKRILLAACASLALGGCSLSPSADVIKALASDQNQICFTGTSVYASFSLDRNHGCGTASAPVVVVSPGGPGNIAPSHVEVIRP